MLFYAVPALSTRPDIAATGIEIAEIRPMEEGFWLWLPLQRRYQSCIMQQGNLRVKLADTLPQRHYSSTAITNRVCVKGQGRGL